MRKYTWDEYYEEFYDWSTSTQIRHLSDLTSYGSSDEITEVALELCDEKAASRLVNRAFDAGVHFSAVNIGGLNDCIDADSLQRIINTMTDSFTDKELEILGGCMDGDIFLTLVKKSGSDQHSPEIIMILLETSDDEDYIRKLLTHVNGFFSPEQLEQLRDTLDEGTVEPLVENSLKRGVRFTPEEVVDWSYCDVSELIIKEMALTVKGEFSKEQAETLYYNLPEDVYVEIAKHHHLDVFDYGVEYEEPVYNVPKPKLGFFGTLFAVAAGLGSAANPSEHHNGRCTGNCASCPPHYGYRYGRWYFGHCHQYGCEFGGNRGDGSMD